MRAGRTAGPPFAAEATVTGVSGPGGPSLEGVAPSLSYYAGATASGTPIGAAPSAAGTYTVAASFAGSADYLAQSAQATFTIAQATPTVNVGDAGGTYKDSPFAATATVAGVNGGAGGSLEGVGPTLSYFAGSTPLSGAPTAAGTYTVPASFAGSADYLARSAQATFTIAQAAPTVNVSDDGRDLQRLLLRRRGDGDGDRRPCGREPRRCRRHPELLRGATGAARRSARPRAPRGPTPSPPPSPAAPTTSRDRRRRPSSSVRPRRR